MNSPSRRIAIVRLTTALDDMSTRHPQPLQAIAECLIRSTDNAGLERILDQIAWTTELIQLESQNRRKPYPEPVSYRYPEHSASVLAQTPTKTPTPEPKKDPGEKGKGKVEITFDQAYEAILRALVAYENRPGGTPLENSATLIGDIAIAVIEAPLLGVVPQRERMFRPFDQERPFYKRPKDPAQPSYVDHETGMAFYDHPISPKEVQDAQIKVEAAQKSGRTIRPDIKAKAELPASVQSREAFRQKAAAMGYDIRENSIAAYGYANQHTIHLYLGWKAGEAYGYQRAYDDYPNVYRGLWDDYQKALAEITRLKAKKENPTQPAKNNPGPDTYEQPEEYFLKGGGGFEGTKEAARFSFAGMCEMALVYAEYRVAAAESAKEKSTTERCAQWLRERPGAELEIFADRMLKELGPQPEAVESRQCAWAYTEGGQWQGNCQIMTIRESGYCETHEPMVKSKVTATVEPQINAEQLAEDYLNLEQDALIKKYGMAVKIGASLLAETMRFYSRHDDRPTAKCMRIYHMHKPEDGCWHDRPKSVRLQELTEETYAEIVRLSQEKNDALDAISVLSRGLGNPAVKFGNGKTMQRAVVDLALDRIKDLTAQRDATVDSLAEEAKRKESAEIILQKYLKQPWTEDTRETKQCFFCGNIQKKDSNKHYPSCPVLTQKSKPTGKKPI